MCLAPLTRATRAWRNRWVAGPKETQHVLKHILERQVRGKGDGVSDAPRAACLPPLLTTPACVSPWHLAGDLDEKGRAFLAAIDPEDVDHRLTAVLGAIG